METGTIRIRARKTVEIATILPAGLYERRKMTYSQKDIKEKRILLRNQNFGKSLAFEVKNGTETTKDM